MIADRFATALIISIARLLLLLLPFIRCECGQRQSVNALLHQIVQAVVHQAVALDAHQAGELRRHDGDLRGRRRPA